MCFTMKSFVAALACVAVANASVLPAAYAGYGYGAGYATGYNGLGYAVGYNGLGYAAAPALAYAGQPLAAAIAPAAGVSSGLYDPTVAYSRAYPAAEPYVDVQVPAEPYVDVQ